MDIAALHRFQRGGCWQQQGPRFPWQLQTNEQRKYHTEDGMKRVGVCSKPRLSCRESRCGHVCVEWPVAEKS